MAHRRVSLFDPGAQPIRRRNLSKPAQFGYKLLWVETWESFISHFRLHGGNPSDDKLLVAAGAGHIATLGTQP